MGQSDVLETYSDEQLLKLLKNNDGRAFRSLYERYWPKLFDAAYKRLKSKEAAEEIIQDIFTVLWCNRMKIEVRHTFSTYIHSALKYKVFDYYSSLSVERNYIDAVQQGTKQYSFQVEEEILFNELNNAIEAEIKRLPDRCREAFNLSRKENLSSREIASQMEISVNTVEKHVGKALKILRANLKEYVLSSILIAIRLLSL